MKKPKTLTLKLTSKSGEDELEVPEDLWRHVEKRAKELGVSPERLLTVALADFMVKNK